MKIERVFVIVLDGVGVGALPDAAEYGDEGSSTLPHTALAVGGLNLPTLQSLGIGNIVEIEGVPPASMPRACFGRMRERSPGKDSITGHWEMMGVVLEYPFPVYPNGFPPEIIHEFEAAIKTKTLGNIPASGTEIIYRLGLEHEMTGYPIIYTSADSVFQIAAHEGIISVERLYEMCRIARQILTGRHGVGRVIARPFEGHAGAYRRTERRRDFPLDPPPTTLDALQSAGHSVHSIGKIREFFNGRGITTWDDTSNNADHIAALIHAAQSNRSALIFANLEDFDMLFGHRNEPRGFADALQAFDAALPQILEPLRDTDLLILTNDHGNDPTTPSTDHSREYAFLLAYSPLSGKGRSLGERASFCDISATIREAFELPPGHNGESFLSAVVGQL
jgi:phosphopentomutase